MFVFVSDMYAQEYVGGAELTTHAILEKTTLPVVCLKSQMVNEQVVEYLKDRHWIFGNFSAMTDETILHCCKNLKYSIIEYDYKYCKFRLPEKHVDIEGFCGCEDSDHGKLISVFYANAKRLWFMSEQQKKFYCEKFPFLDKPTSQVLSSVFDEGSLSFMKSLNISEKNDKWLIQESNSWVKGTEQAIKYAEDNNLDYETFSNIPYNEMLEKFAKSRGFIFLPRSMDTCPRTVIEAKLLGCELVMNNNVQHKDESWFAKRTPDTYKYLESRADCFWKSMLEEVSHIVPNEKYSENEKTHFKVVIPSYNSESWITRTINTVKSQEYSNYECIVSDDVSTDLTYELASSFKSEKIMVEKQTEKKYALRNINDSIERLNPSPDDVIVVLDGDDWFSSNHVLSKLDEYYTTKKCMATYGSFVQFPQGNIGQESSEYPQDVIDENSYRTEQWRASHLKTFKYSLWNKIRKEDLKDSSGNFYEVSYDQAMMLPILEMAGSRCVYIPEVLYVYNTSNPNAVNKTREEKQYKSMLDIRSKQKYERLEDEGIS